MRNIIKGAVPPCWEAMIKQEPNLQFKDLEKGHLQEKAQLKSDILKTE